MECQRCLLSDDILGVKLGDHQCNYCDLHDQLEKEYPIDSERLKHLVERIKRRGRGKKYDCLIGISGGSDSTFLMYWAYANGLRTLSFHFDNGFNTEIAERNMKRILEFTGFDHIRIRVNSKEYNALNRSFLEASVSDCDIPNDIAMGSLLLNLAMKYDVKTILNGHNFRTEGSSPIGWTYMDGMYIKDVYYMHTFKYLYSYPNLSIWDQIKASLKGIKHERPFYYMGQTKKENKDFLKDMIGFEDYTGWHCENKYTHFAGWVAYKKFNIDKRRVQYSAEIRSGRINKKLAQLIIEDKISEPTEVVKEIVEKLNVDYPEVMSRKRRMFYEFDTYNDKFIKYKWLIWIGYKLHFLPKTFYTKYTKKFY
jgi:PP-loop superfamily ATP-utilizing enzyme